MKSFKSKFKFSVAIAIADLLHLAKLADGTNEFRRCYNTSVEMHCFEMQYDTTKSQSLTASFYNAQQRCNALKSTLLIIKDEETNQLLEQFMNDTYNPIRLQNAWIDAYRLNSFNATYRFSWQWLDSTLPNISALDVVDTPDYGWYVAALEFKDNRFRLTGQQPHFGNSHVCEYPVSKCLSIISNSVRQFDGKCYTAVNESVSWYEARNRCLRGAGDLAWFANVSSINFTSWLGSNTSIRYCIGLRFARYTWKDSGEDVKFSKWILNGDDWISPCLILCSNCSQKFSWFPKACNITDSINVVCHSATTLPLTTTSAITTPISLSSSGSEIPQSSNNSNRLAIGIGVGVGVGVLVLIAAIVLVICIVLRKRRRETISSVQSTNRQQAESSFDQLPPVIVREKDEIEGSAYGTVVPSTLSRQAAEAEGVNSATGQTEYAPLQFL